MSLMRAQARRYANRDAWIEGRRFFETRVEQYPLDAQARAHLAFFVVKESRYDTQRALRLLDEAIALDPGCAIAWVYKSMVLGTLLDESGAREALERAEAAGALEEDVVRTRAWNALDVWKLDEAIAGFEHLVEICAESSSCVLLATAFLQAGKHDDARRWALAAVEREPDDFRGHAYAGIAVLAQGSVAEARAHLEQAAALAPDSPMVAHALGMAALREGDLTRAERHLRAAVRIDPLYVTSQRALADLCARDGRTAEARRHYEAALAVFPGYLEARAGLEALPGEE